MLNDPIIICLHNSAYNGARSVKARHQEEAVGEKLMGLNVEPSRHHPAGAAVLSARSSRRHILGLATGVSALTLLAACGQRRTGGGPATNRERNTGLAKSGGSVAIRVSADPYDWDVTYLGNGSPNLCGIEVAYNKLVGFKAGPALKYTDLVIQPELSQKWETPDAQTYTFHLRQGVTFADLAPVNGRPLGVSDVKWSLEYLSRTGQFQAKHLQRALESWTLEGIDQVQTPDQATVVVHFGKPFTPFLNYAGFPYNPILPHEIFDQDGNLKGRIAGTGPWQLDAASSQKGTRWVWKKNPTYWDSGKPYIDQITWLVLPDDSTAYAGFQTRQVDLLGGGGTPEIAPQSLQQLKQLRQDLVAYQYANPAPMHLYMMVSKPPLNDKRLRQAISYAIDRDELIRTMTANQGTWALAGAFPDTYSQAEIHQMLKYDPAQAKQLLSAAGYANGLDLEFIYPGNAYGDSYLQTMQLLQAQLKKANINLNLKSVDKPAYESSKRTHNYQMTMTGKKLEVDVDSYLYAVFYPGAGANYGDVNDPQLTSLLVAQRQEADPNKRRATVREAVKRINVDEVLALALYYPEGIDVWQPRLKNYAPNFGAFAWPLASSWLAS
jgi:peptide/nickel transport system substrate-binding protein